MEQVVSIYGDTKLGGIYLLQITVNKLLDVTFGKFQGGYSIRFAPGEYLYLGSANKKGTFLAHRVIRHLNRSGQKQSHSALLEVTDQLSSVTNTALTAMRQKKLHWHIDYLLDHEQVAVKAVIIIAHPHPIEKKITKILMTDSHTAIIAVGLGAQDHRGYTHLLRVDAPEIWWAQLGDRIIASLGRDKIESI